MALGLAGLLETVLMSPAPQPPRDTDQRWSVIPIAPVGKELGDKLAALVEALEDLDDTQSVYTNAENPS